MKSLDRTVVVGIGEGERDAVVLVAAEFAAQLGAELVVVVVDEAHYTATDRSGRPVIAPIDSDSVDDVEGTWAGIEEHLHEVLDRVTTRWTIRFITGEPSFELAAVAGEVNALMIVIGTRRRTLARSFREFIEGSISAHLAHRQARPILVVPLDPAPLDDGVPSQNPDVAEQ